MTVCEKAVRTWGHEDIRTIAICTLVVEHQQYVAERLFDTLTEKED